MEELLFSSLLLKPECSCSLMHFLSKEDIKSQTNVSVL